jgi:hypothetical protein
MSKVFVDPDNGCVMYECPGCGYAHSADKRWTFNGDLKNPTLNPSYLVHEDKKAKYKRCHHYVRDGKIQYLADCGHGLAGQTVEMKNW